MHKHQILARASSRRSVWKFVRRDGLQAELIRVNGQMPIHLALAHTAVSGNALVLQLDVEITRLSIAKRACEPTARHLSNHAHQCSAE